MAVLCIGSKQCVGDSLGPLVGEILSQYLPNQRRIKVLGNMHQCLSYQVVEVLIKEIHKRAVNPYIVVVDAALAPKTYVGNIVVSKHGLIPGRALKRKGVSLGNVTVRGIVGEEMKTREENLQVLYQVSPRLIAEMSYQISNQIYQAIMNK